MKRTRIIVLTRNGGGLSETQMSQLIKYIPRKAYEDTFVLLSGEEYAAPEYLHEFLQEDDVVLVLVKNGMHFLGGENNIPKFKELLKMSKSSYDAALRCVEQCYANKGVEPTRIILLPHKGELLTKEQLSFVEKNIPLELYENRFCITHEMKYNDPKYLLNILKKGDVVGFWEDDNVLFASGEKNLRNIKRFLKKEDVSSNNALLAYKSFFKKQG